MKISLNWLRDFITLPPQHEKLAEDLTLAGLTVEGIHETNFETKDVVFETEVTTNRPDWLSHWGVAREAAAVRDLPIKPPEVFSKMRGTKPPGWTLEINDTKNCHYYTGVLIEDLQSCESPAFIRSRLAACGIRSIGLIVDITNYVMLETGHPLHAFDANTLKGSRVKIRKAKKGEKLSLIDGRELTLTPEDLVIADSERAVALAGVMGGKLTEVTAQTRHVFLESAYFAPSCVRQMAHRHSAASDSSYRFERKVDPHGVDFARNRALWLIEKFGKPRSISGVLHAGQVPLTTKPAIKLSLEAVEKILGVSLKCSEVLSILTRLGLTVSSPSSKSVTVKVPSFRGDLTGPHDLIEEIARIHGFDKIPETLPARAPLQQAHVGTFQLERFLRPRLAGLGFSETVTFSLITSQGLDAERDLKHSVELRNPQNQEMRWMRTTLLPSLLNAAKKNFFLGAKQIFFFEIARTYHQPSQGAPAVENKVLSLLLSGELRSTTWIEPGRKAVYHDLKGRLLSLLSSLGITQIRFSPLDHRHFQSGVGETLYIHDKPAGHLGSIHHDLCRHWDIENEVFFCEINLESLRSSWIQIKPLTELPRFPAVVRDLSVIVPENVKAGDMERLIQELGTGLVREVRLFDVFRGGRIPAGFKNLGLSLVYQSLDRTLVADEVQKLHTHIAENLVKKYQATFQTS